jgi:type IV pilus assembly protein PilX
MTTNSVRRRGGVAQRGVALVISLLILLVLTIIGVAAMQSTTMDNKMAGNMRDESLAFEAGEAGLRDAEGWINSQNVTPGPPKTSCTSPCASTNDVWARWDASPLPDWYPGQFTSLTTAWWTNNAREYGFDYPDDTDTAEFLPGNTEPRYVIEDWDFVRDSLTLGIGIPTGRNYYRITALGTGGQASTTTIVQSVFVKRFN